MEQMANKCSEVEKTSEVGKDHVNEDNQPKQKNLAKPFKIIGNFAFFILLFLMVFLVFSTVQSRLTGHPPTVAGHQMYIVLGGSMSPTFEAGSLAFVKPIDPGILKESDIITYKSATGGSLTTHRIMEVMEEGGQRSFITRGDANIVNDSRPVISESIVGKVAFSIPYAGFILSYGQTPVGALTLIIIPGLFIILFELRNLFKYAAQWEEDKKREKGELT